MMRRCFQLAIGLALAACTQTATSQTVSSTPPPQPAGAVQHIQWRALAAAGEDNAPVFDNAVDKMTEILAAHGVTPVDRFTSDPMRVRADRPLTTADSMAAALNARHPGPGQGCLVFLTSHGSREGLVLRGDLDSDRSLSPSALGRILDEGCGSAPTVAIVSGCFSGIFIGAVTEAPNRIILTAARDDRTSFGCGAEFEFTYFDDCLFQSWPRSKTWAALYRATTACVQGKERAINQQPSEPQAYFGDQVANLALP
jgi:peptidase C13-like protein